LVKIALKTLRQGTRWSHRQGDASITRWGVSGRPLSVSRDPRVVIAYVARRVFTTLAVMVDPLADGGYLDPRLR
jgi:hypothetical protein